MKSHLEKPKESQNPFVADEVSQLKSTEGNSRSTDHSSSITQRKIQKLGNNSSQVSQLAAVQGMADQYTSSQQHPIQKKANNTGLPNQLKAGIENLSGVSMDDVKVHYNSPKPAQLQAHAYAQGTEIHVASGQEKHLAHEAWHVVQQKQNRVKATRQFKSAVAINDDPKLEKEADEMGAKASVHQLVSHFKPTPRTASGTASPIAQLLKLNAGQHNEQVVNIDNLSLERIYDYLGRTADPVVTFEHGDLAALRARADHLLPGAFNAIHAAQTSGADLAILHQRNVQVGGADQQMLLDFMHALSTAGSLRGFDHWIAAVSAQGAVSRQDHMNELWEVARQFFFHGVRNIDLSEQAIPGTAQTADLTAGNLQVEVKTVQAPITRPSDLDHQLTAGLAKFAGVAANHGKQYEVSIYASFNHNLLTPAGLAVGVTSRSINPRTLVQTVTITPPPAKDGQARPQVVRPEFDYAAALAHSLNNSHWPGADLATKVSIVMENSKSYYAVNTHGVWTAHIY